MNTLTLETALSERDVAALHAWQEQQRQNVAELEAALDFERSQVARLMDLLIETQANENHYKRALEWLADRISGGVGIGGSVDFEIDCGHRKWRAKNAEDWVDAALATTKEAIRNV